nr:peroxiredoxin-like family protein [uncultured Marinifilum sp.]
MKLQEKLTALKKENLSKLPSEVRLKVLEDLEILEGSGIVKRIPKKGDKLLDFNLTNHLGTNVNLSTLRAKGPVVITFYRGGWCPYCNLELRAYQDILPEIKALGANLVAITPENPDESLTTSERHNLEFEVLTDDKSEYAKQLGITFTISEEIRPIYKAFGIEIEKHNGIGQFEVPLAATFIVDSDNTVLFTFAKADYTFRAEPADILKELTSLKNNLFKKK